MILVYNYFRFCYAGVLFVLSYLGIKKNTIINKSILIIGIILRVIVSFSFISLKHYDTISYFTIGHLAYREKQFTGLCYYHYPYFPGLFILRLFYFFRDLAFLICFLSLF